MPTYDPQRDAHGFMERFSFIRTMTVGPGIAPDLLTLLACGQKALAGSRKLAFVHTAGGEFHPALRTLSATHRRGSRYSIATSANKTAPTCKAVRVSSEEFYTGLIALAYAPLRGTVAPSEPYERFVRRYGEPALEIGCGHGEPLLDLLANGLDVTGLDSSPDMLALCAADAERRGMAVNLVCQRMELMSLDGKFRSIYFAGPTFQLVTEVDAALEALKRIAAHLEPDGRALVPLFTPARTDPALFGEWREHTFPNGDVVALTTINQSYRVNEQRVDTTLRYRRGPAESPTEMVDRVWSLCWYANESFEQLATRAGLIVDRVIDHGSFGESYVLTLAAGL
jgi:SAM-dependent methyltransferase